MSSKIIYLVIKKTSEVIGNPIKVKRGVTVTDENNNPLPYEPFINLKNAKELAIKQGFSIYKWEKSDKPISYAWYLKL